MLRPSCLVVLFAVGCAVFLWAYPSAVQRSRTDLIGIGGLYFLQGTAPQAVQFRLLGSLVVRGCASRSSRRRSGSYTALAFGFLAPVFGLGMCGLWAARHGTFEPRPSTRVTAAAGGNGKNARDGR